ncbi:50S ribosomal protein L2 [Candidatus Deianiraea vastatrix]|uniref:Large ribosomal subunit protein uL2 n=1 Tax=Candidatus Deianiraea vastatrix TaxID=2163644 RepID=A0A5B8XG19_9RICK|nr:50S ribosomal protein L2 [Candidatus Deianiraea vastatrix]QED23191.1 50S ribosomal protein L2 [Candidatus Deianiraea vastatrix]
MKLNRKKINPTTPSNRFFIPVIKHYEDNGVERAACLISNKKRSSGRDNHGRITSRRRGGGAKRAYRKISFKWSRSEIGTWFEILNIQYDPNRNVPIALIKSTSGKSLGELKYVISCEGMQPGGKMYFNDSFIENLPGSIIPIGNMPSGLSVYCVELKPYKGFQMARSAGTFVKISGKDGDYVIVKLPSGEIRKIHKDCLAAIGEVANKDMVNVSIGKAGRNRWKGIRPSVRGVAMNPVDHPHGGGEGKTSGGGHPRSPWGKNCKGKKTRVNKRTSAFILSRKKRK